jgi:hypothetical protein
MAQSVPYDAYIVNFGLGNVAHWTATGETADQESSTQQLPNFGLPPGFVAGTVFLLENSGGELPGTITRDGFPANTSDAFTLTGAMLNGQLNIWFVSDGADQQTINNFNIVAGNQLTIMENGELQDVSALFGVPAGSVLVASIPEPGTVALVGLSLVGLLTVIRRRK